MDGALTFTLGDVVVIASVALSYGGIIWRIRSLESIVKGNGHDGLIDKVEKNTGDIAVLAERCKLIHEFDGSK